MSKSTISRKQTSKGPLNGIKVLDLTIAMAGPMCTQRMAEMGAEVIKIEAPGGGDFSRASPMAGVTKFEDSICYVTLNRNKKSLVLNLKDDEGRKILYQMAKDADVFVQNFRPRVASKLGIDYKTLEDINPRLVYASISGYGDEGEMANRPGQDLLVQSFCGLTMNAGEQGGLPHPSPLFMVDVSASHAACEGILAALIARSKTGRGQEIKVSLLSAILEMQCQEITTFLATDFPPRRSKSHQVSIYMDPPYGVYACEKGFLAIAQAELRVLSELLNLPELEGMDNNRPSPADGEALIAWRDTIYSMIAERLKEKPSTYWDEYLNRHNIWCLPVNDYKEFFNHPQSLPYLIELEHPSGGTYKTVAPSIRFSDNPSPQIRTAPKYGEHSRLLLEKMGLTQNQIEGLLERGVIKSSVD